MTKEVRQRINAQVNGHIAGGNVHVSQTIIHHTLWRKPTPEEALKQLVPKVCHSQLDHILNTADVTEKEVLAAWRVNALDCKDGHIVRLNAKLDYWSAGILLAVLAPFLFSFGYLMLWPNLSQQSRLQAWIAFVCTAGIMVITVIWMLKPQRTARRAMRALQKFIAPV
jgi:hypothetical protein